MEFRFWLRQLWYGFLEIFKYFQLMNVSSDCSENVRVTRLFGKFLERCTFGLKSAVYFSRLGKQGTKKRLLPHLLLFSSNLKWGIKPQESLQHRCMRWNQHKWECFTNGMADIKFPILGNFKYFQRKPEPLQIVTSKLSTFRSRNFRIRSSPFNDIW